MSVVLADSTFRKCYPGMRVEGIIAPLVCDRTQSIIRMRTAISIRASGESFTHLRFQT